MTEHETAEEKLARVLSPDGLRAWIAARPEERHEPGGWLMLYLNDEMGRFVGWDEYAYGTYLMVGEHTLAMPVWAQCYMWHDRTYRTGAEALADLDAFVSGWDRRGGQV